MILSYVLLSVLMFLAVDLSLCGVSRIGKTGTVTTSATATLTTAFYLVIVTLLYLTQSHLGSTWNARTVLALLAVAYGWQMAVCILQTGKAPKPITPQTANAIVLFQLLQLGALAFLLTAVH